MTRIDWALACNLAFFDREDRLCVVGIVQHLRVPQLPMALTQLMLVARLANLTTIDEVEVAVAVTAPSGRWMRPSHGDGVVIEMAGEYVLITLRDIPLIEAGVHGFQISLSGRAPMSIEIPGVDGQPVDARWRSLRRRTAAH